MKIAASIANVTIAKLWLTSGNQSIMLQQQPDNATALAGSEPPNPIRLNLSDTYQPYEGAGAAMTESAAVMFNSLAPNTRNQTLRQLFDPQTGLGLNRVRIPIGPTDFSFNPAVSYAGSPGAPFNVSRDRENVIPMMQQVLAINPNTHVLASPWSPPAWAKTTNTTCGGNLLYDSMEDYARYLIRFVQTYRAAGIPVHAITPQNEPLYESTGYPTTEMDASTQADFINDHLGPALAQNNLSTQIWAYDHNFDHPEYPALVALNASQYVRGVGFHCYGGSPEAMTPFQQQFPGLPIHMTECSGGTWNGADFAGINDVILGSLANNARSAYLWNLALTSSGGPTFRGDTPSRGVVSIDNGTVSLSSQAASLGHVSKFVQLGALRVGLSGNVTGVLPVAFKNPDGSRVFVAHNNNNQSVTLTVDNVTFALPAYALGTLVLNQTSVHSGGAPNVRTSGKPIVHTSGNPIVRTSGKPIVRTSGASAGPRAVTLGTLVALAGGLRLA